MKKLLLLPLIMLIMCSCTTVIYTYKPATKLVDVSASKNVESPKVNTGFYSDENLAIFIEPSTYGFNIDIQNKTQQTMSVLWSEGAYIDIHNMSQSIAHGGVKVVDVMKYQVPSVIPKGSRIQDTAYPTNNINNSTVSPLFDEAGILVGNKFTLLLPIKINDVVNEYSFTFEITGKIQQEEKVADPLGVLAAIGGVSFAVALCCAGLAAL